MVTHIFYRGNLTEAEQSLEIMALPKVQNTDEMKQQRTDLGIAAVIDRQI